MPNRYDNIPPVDSLSNCIGYYLSQLGAYWQGKSLLAGIIVFYAEVLKGDWMALCVYFIFMTLDVFLKSVIALKGIGRKNFQPVSLSSWVFKVCIHMVTILIIAFINYFVDAAINHSYHVPILGWFMVLLLSTEAITLFQLMDTLGWKIPRPVKTIVRKVSVMAENKLNRIFEGDDNVKPEHPESNEPPPTL